MDVCLACGTDSVAKGEKRLLYNPGAVHLVPVLRSFMNDFFSKDDVDRVVPPHDVARTPGTSTSSYVCRKCFRSLESYKKVRKTLQDCVLHAGSKLLLSKKPDSPVGLQGTTVSQPGKI